jgi:hypothetical protein
MICATCAGDWALATGHKTGTRKAEVRTRAFAVLRRAARRVKAVTDNSLNCGTGRVHDREFAVMENREKSIPLAGTMKEQIRGHGPFGV